MITRVLLYVVAAVLIAAHFLRVGDLVVVALCLATPLLFLLRRRWSLLVLQWLAYVAAAIWLAAAWQIVEMRMAFGEPWLRAALILIAVAGFSMLAGLLLHNNVMQVRYRGR
ncbi:MAG: hypothetical protein WAK63_08010 [Xanthobacteraceae bacterium]